MAAYRLLVSVYAYDTCWLLYDNEAVLRLTRGGDWQIDMPTAGTRLLGRLVYSATLFSVCAVIFRCSWQVTLRRIPDLPSEHLKRLQAIQHTLKPVRRLSFILAILLLVALLLPQLTPLIVLIAIVVLSYLLTIAALILLFIRRKSLGLGANTLDAFTFDSLICLPLAINLPKKVLSRLEIHADALTLSKALLPTSRYQQAVSAILKKVEEEINLSDADTVATLSAYRHILMQELDSEKTMPPT